MTESTTNEIFEILSDFSKEVNKGVELTIKTDKKQILVTDKEKGLSIKIKMQRLNLEDEEDLRMMVRFIKTSGSMYDYHELMDSLVPFLEDIVVEDENE